MKQPNGYGSVHKLSGKRRKPWRVRKTNGWTMNVDGTKLVQQYITIGYYETRQEALQALADYNQDLGAQWTTSVLSTSRTKPATRSSHGQRKRVLTSTV